MSWAVWDLETGIINKFKRKGTPFGDINKVIAEGWKKKDGQIEGQYFGRSGPKPGWMKPLLAAPTKLIGGFNIKFDLLHALQDPENLEAWMEYVANGGMVWDCQIAEYLLNGMGQKEQMLSLDEVAPRYGGNLKVDEVKALWEAGVDTPDIDPDLLMRYLLGGPDANGVRQEGDIGNTELIMLEQIQRARVQGQLKSCLLNMGSLLCTVEMERNGMFVDMELAMKLADELRGTIDLLRQELEKFLPQDMPFEFKWSSPFHKSALIFGGSVKWDGHEHDLADGGTIYSHVYDAMPEDQRPKLVYSQMDEEHYLYADGSGTVSKEWYDLRVREGDIGLPDIVYYKSGKNEGQAKTKKVKVDNLTKPKGRNVPVPYTFKGFTTPKKKWERNDYPGVYSTASEVIEELGMRDVPFLEALGKLTAATKDLTTYYIVTDPETGESKGMLSLVDPLGIIHHRINHTNTVTGRFSSSDPNLQNISKGMFDLETGKQKGSQIKRTFVSRFKDGLIIQSDFTALEVYVQAILTQCKQLIEDLKAGLDMHCVRVSQKEGISYEEAVKLCKGYTDEDGKWHDADPEWDKKRTQAKVFSFQRAYGAGAAKIAESVGMPLEEVEALIKAEEERYPEISAYYDGVAAAIKASRKPGPYPLPHPDFPGVMCNLGTGSFITPDGKLYSYQEHPAPEYLVKRGTTQSFSPTEIKNYVAQGSGGEWAKAAMWLAVRAFYARRNFEHRALLVNQVHDALYADSHPDVARPAAVLLHACMESASDFMEFYFNWEVPVPVPSDTTWGKSMMDEGKIHGVREDAAPLRQELRDLYMSGYKPSFI